MKRLEKTFHNKFCWITGGGTGIGRALALKIAEFGGRVLISGRRKEVLEKVCSGEPNIALLQLDVTDSEAWKEAARYVEKEENRLDHIIFNAGTCEYIDLPEFDSKSFERVLNINFHGIVKGLEATLPLLRKTSDSHITAVTSSVALLSLPRAEAYGASKAAATYLMNSLRLDLKNSGIKISTVLPGFVETPMTDKNDFPMPFKISPEAAADRILNGISRGKKEIYFPHRFSLPLRLLAALPISIQQIFTRSFVR